MKGPPPSLKGKALQLLAQREHSRHELASKLRRHAQRALLPARNARGNSADQAFDALDDTGANPGDAGTPDGYDARETAQRSQAQVQADIDRAIDDLTAAGFQSDQRTAETLLHAQSRRYGALRLKRNLQLKGLAPELVTQTLSQALPTEFERAKAVWQRRYGQAAQDRNELARQMRFLAARGFSGDIVRRVLRAQPGPGAELDDDTDESPLD